MTRAAARLADAAGADWQFRLESRPGPLAGAAPRSQANAMIGKAVVILLWITIDGAVCDTLELTPIQNLSRCFLANTSSPSRMLKYPDGSLHPVMIPFAVWASAQIVSQLAHILLSEVMGYSVQLLENAGKDSGQPIRYAAGCVDILDLTCSHNNLLRPRIHFSVETWTYGISVAESMPSDIKPALLNLLDYNAYDATYLWGATVQDGAKQRQSLDYYKASPSTFFILVLLHDWAPWMCQRTTSVPSVSRNI